MLPLHKEERKVKRVVCNYKLKVKYRLRKGLLPAILCFLLSDACFGQGILSALAEMHSVSKGDTWESVAAERGVSVEELRAANPDVKSDKLKKGSFLIIPTRPQPPREESGRDGQGEFIPVLDGPGSVLVRTMKTELKVGVLLPFAEKKMVEFYRGLLMAADSVRQSGVNLDIHAWDSGSSMSQIESLLPQLNGFDVLFGPVSATQMPAVAEACREQGTRLVLPFWSGQALLDDYPLVYNATAPGPVFYDAAVKKLVSYYGDKNFVIVHSGNTDNLDKSLSEKLSQVLSQRTITPRILELEGDDFAYESAFNQFRDNVIVLDDSSVRSLGILLARLKDFRKKHSEYRLSLIGYPEWQDEKEQFIDDFFSFDTYIISSYYFNEYDERTKLFQQNYEKSFHTSVVQSTPCYATFGFDLGCYFLSGIRNLGDTFEQMQGGQPQVPYQYWFSFERNASGMSFTNKFVQFLHFTPERMIELIR